MDGLIDSFLNIAANVIDLIDTSNLFVGIGNIYGGHVKTCAIEPRSFAQFLNNLHHDPLAIGLMTGLISLGQVKPNLLRMFDAQSFDNIEGSLTKSLKIKIEKSVKLTDCTY